LYSSDDSLLEKEVDILVSDLDLPVVNEHTVDKERDLAEKEFEQEEEVVQQLEAVNEQEANGKRKREADLEEVSEEVPSLVSVEESKSKKQKTTTDAGMSYRKVAGISLVSFLGGALVMFGGLVATASQ
jgi:hypothetical protein